MGRKRSMPVPLGQALDKALRLSGKTDVLRLARIAGQWGQAVGLKLERVSRPAKLSRKILTVWVTEPVWVDTMMYMKSTVIEKVNALFKYQVVTRLKVVTKSGLDTGVAKPALAEREERLDESLLSNEDCESLLAIADSGLRSTFKRIMLKDLMRKSGSDKPFKNKT